MKKVIAGIQPSNNITLGNYLGAIKELINLQNNNEILVFIADLHAITTNNLITKKFLEYKIDLAKTLIACGFDINKNIIFTQSDVSEHTELGYILACNTTLGELNRMTQFKDKSSKAKADNNTEYIPTGLLIYPTLMAADILLYQSDIVVVGNDQTQHLELTKNIAVRINNKFKKEIFKIPSPCENTINIRIMDLVNPEIKMSKSNDSKGTILISDSENDIKKKIKTSLTDNFNKVKFDIVNQKGISNLMNIYKYITNKSIEEIEEEFKDIENYGIFKTKVSDVVCDFIMDIQNKKNNITDQEIIEILSIGKNKAKKIAKENMNVFLKEMNLK
jgi:tryptophanyl-tRNA synthetase